MREIGNILNVTFPDNATDKEIGSYVANGYKKLRDDILGLPSFEHQGIDRKELQKLRDEVANERFSANSPFEVTADLVAAALVKFG